MERNMEYVYQLKQLILQIQTRVGRLDFNTKNRLAEAAKWICPDKEEKKLLNELINRATEFIELERIVNETKYSREDIDKYSSYNKWFGSINMLLGTFDVRLSQVSFTDLTLKE